ncbi:uncharacterized protein C8Q71DRAFT_328133 [Rhodofomes roseus]|uniref:Transmembrane protein n=1 Tax=Rhodofomes roseus TaxID=34475 RepID=A0ABQ8KTS9_9APHY|nr:uncharacterized protein C8Q71DRAFT_328133 [Rhodofomes roseus]KAH9841408.1 hypothetical protein C8Q71DRAFT_328133 [Rhodofomes roseus]
MQIATRACNAAVDALVLFATWRVTWSVAKIGRSTDLKVSLTSLLLRDGSVYFGVLLILNILNATLWLTHVYNNITVFSNVFSIILLSHFFLNLRTAALNPNDSTTEQTSHMSDIRFTSALGNFGSAVAGSSTDDGTERGDELEWFDDDTETYAMSDGRSHSALATGEAGSSLRRKSQHDETSV